MRVEKRHMLPNGIELRATRKGELIHFSGSATGDHSLHAPSSSPARIQAHWMGYLKNSQDAYWRYINR